MNKNTLIGVSILIAATLVGFGISLVTRDVYEKSDVSEESAVLGPYDAPTPDDVPTPDETIYPDQPVDVKWQDPLLSKGLDVFKSYRTDSEVSIEDVAKYYKIGIVSTGTYKGGDVFVVTAPADGPGGDYVYRIINNSGKVTFLIKNSHELYNPLDCKKLNIDPLDCNKLLVDKSAILSDLIFPAKITYRGHTFSFEGDNVSEPFYDKIYAPSDLKLVFVDPKLGNIYTDVSGKETSRGNMRQNGFYAKAPDGTLRVYSLDIDFYDKNRNIPNVTWTDNTINTGEYITTDRGGCGSTNYASVTQGLSNNDIFAIGKTPKGDAIYELKDKNSPILQKIYNDDYNPYDNPKVPFEQFIRSKPVFFWFDPFGRLIKFQKSEFIPQGECGKPVIYLYPEKTTEISVKVTPKGGFTKTEPAYGNGWNVLATPDSELTDINTGRMYPYLFWEGHGGIYNTPEKGFVVVAEDVHGFLVEKLTKLGLNQKEQNDFIEFWEPRMTGAPYFFVTFMGNREMDAMAPLTIIPKPDTVIRILMDFLPLQKPIPVSGYEIKTPTRNGFTVVEWGGVLR